MKYVYYKNKRYQALPVTIGNTLCYSLYDTDGVLIHFVACNEVSKPSFINNFFETYLRLSEHA